MYACVAAVLIAVFLERATHYLELAERTAVEVTVQRVNTGLRLKLATDIIAGRRPGEGISQTNPFALADVAPPPTFRGDAQGANAIEAGTWVFDRVSRELVYRPRHRRGLITQHVDGSIRFRVMPHPHGHWALTPTNAYQWD